MRIYLFFTFCNNTWLPSRLLNLLVMITVPFPWKLPEVFICGEFRPFSFVAASEGLPFVWANELQSSVDASCGPWLPLRTEEVKFGLALMLVNFSMVFGSGDFCKLLLIWGKVYWLSILRFGPEVLWMVPNCLTAMIGAGGEDDFTSFLWRAAVCGDAAFCKV